MPPGLAVMSDGAGLPTLPELEFVIIGPGGGQPIVEMLTTTILKWATTAGNNGS
jgi:hypothetical protein